MPTARHLSPSTDRHSRRGSVILFVLGVIFLTAFLLTRFIDRSGGELLAEAKASSRAPLREEAYSVLDAALGVLASFNATDGGLHAPGQGWQNPLAYTQQAPNPGYTATVVIEDESGRLPLQHVDAATLQRYLEGIGCTRTDAEHVVDALMVWTKQGYTALTTEADPHQYESAPLPYGPPQRALRSWDELKAIRVTRELFFDETGRWNELGQRFRRGASLHNFARVNVNSASPDVLVGLGLDPQMAGKVDQVRSDPRTTPYQRTVGEASTAWGTDLSALAAGADALCLRVKVTVAQGARVYRLEAVVSPGNSAQSGPPPSAPSSTPATGNASTTTEGTTAVRSWSRNKVDYPFRILELREDTGP
jgi:hypothetical protein